VQTPDTGIRRIDQRRHHTLGSPFGLASAVATKDADLLILFEEVISVFPVKWLITVTVWVCFLSNDLLFSDPKDPSDFGCTYPLGQIFKILRAWDLENWMGA
jgi:hypothetical protein